MATLSKMDGEKNIFFDINKLPPEKGLLLFGLSMSKLDNRQNAQNCVEDIRVFGPKKVSKPLIGLNFLYADFLYLYSNKPAPELKQTFMHQVINHKNSLQKILSKNQVEFQIQQAFSYLVWNQLYVGTTDFSEKLNEIKRIFGITRKTTVLLSPINLRNSKKKKFFVSNSPHQSTKSLQFCIE